MRQCDDGVDWLGVISFGVDQVHLLGSTGEEVKSRRVPLRLVLMYENMHRVHNQEILKLSPDSKLVIDEHGKATLRVRIEEVSKNHQKQVQLALS